MKLTKEWIESQKKSLAQDITQLERDLYAKDGAIQALDLVLGQMEEVEIPSAEAEVIA